MDNCYLHIALVALLNLGLVTGRGRLESKENSLRLLTEARLMIDEANTHYCEAMQSCLDMEDVALSDTSLHRCEHFSNQHSATLPFPLIPLYQENIPEVAASLTLIISTLQGVEVEIGEKYIPEGGVADCCAGECGVPAHRQHIKHLYCRARHATVKLLQARRRVFQLLQIRPKSDETALMTRVDQSQHIKLYSLVAMDYASRQIQHVIHGLQQLHVI